jgi:hypothetical protein
MDLWDGKEAWFGPKDIHSACGVWRSKQTSQLYAQNFVICFAPARLSTAQ